jgi:pimeloyl-ACP methyl ester carboxylesterase
VNAYTLALCLLLGVILGGLWLWGVGRVYAIAGPRPEPQRVLCPDGWELTVFRRPAQKRRFREPVLLAHGLAANHVNFDFEPPHSLAHHLAAKGFDCYTVEWRGTGASARPPPGGRRGDFGVDDHIRLDAPAVLEHIARDSGAERVYWVGHSLGGLIGYAVAQGEGASRLAGLVTIASPAYFAQHRPFLRRALTVGSVLAWPRIFRQAWMSRALAPFLGHLTLPLTEILVNPEHIPPPLQRKLYANLIGSVSRKVLLQFRDWLTHDAFRSEDHSVDYRKGLERLRLPVLVLGGSQDALAPSYCIEAAYAQLGSTDKTLVIFGREHGDRMDYGHGDVIFGAGAPEEVFPAVSRWLESHATTAER